MLLDDLQNDINGTAKLITSLQPYVAMEKCVANMGNGFITCMRKIVQSVRGISVIYSCHLPGGIHLSCSEKL